MWRRLVDLARKRHAFWLSVPATGHALILAAVFSVFADRLKQSLAANAGRPLRDIFERMVADVRRHGSQLDDQSLRLVRVST